MKGYLSPPPAAQTATKHGSHFGSLWMFRFHLNVDVSHSCWGFCVTNLLLADSEWCVSVSLSQRAAPKPIQYSHSGSFLVE